MSDLAFEHVPEDCSHYDEIKAALPPREDQQ